MVHLQRASVWRNLWGHEYADELPNESFTAPARQFYIRQGQSMGLRKRQVEERDGEEKMEKREGKWKTVWDSRLSCCAQALFTLHKTACKLNKMYTRAMMKNGKWWRSQPLAIDWLTHVCVFIVHLCVNAAGLQGSISLPYGAKLREGQSDGYILTCTQPVMSAVCAFMCVTWQASWAQARFSGAEGGQASGEVLALAPVP